jgi:hypothetical protein
MYTSNNTVKKSAFKDIIKFGCLGILMGFIIIAVVEIKLNIESIRKIDQELMTNFESGSETQYLLGKAGYAVLNDDNEAVISILLPNISKFTNRNEASQAYGFLAAAEYKLGHPQLAAGYLELMYANEPTTHNLYTLALAYDGGGNLKKALEKYALVVSFQDGTVQPNEIAYAQQRIQEIMAINGINNQSP